MSQTHDQDHQKLLDIGVPQHAIDNAQRRGIGGGKILTLIGKLLPTILEFLSENAGEQSTTHGSRGKGGEDRPGGGDRPTLQANPQTPKK